MIINGDKRSTNTNAGLLDIFGFEIMEENGFEQLCINFANEKLQLYFNAEMLAKEQSEYAAEGVDWQQVEFRDNNGESVCNISRRPR